MFDRPLSDEAWEKAEAQGLIYMQLDSSQNINVLRPFTDLDYKIVTNTIEGASLNSEFPLNGSTFKGVITLPPGKYKSTFKLNAFNVTNMQKVVAVTVARYSPSVVYYPEATVYEMFRNRNFATISNPSANYQFFELTEEQSFGIVSGRTSASGIVNTIADESYWMIEKIDTFPEEPINFTPPADNVYVLYDTATGTVLDYSEEDFTPGDGQASALVNHLFWDAQPLYLYRYNGTEIEANTEQNIAPYIIDSSSLGLVNYLGSFSSVAEMNAIESPSSLNYIGRTDTGTIWQYIDGAWLDTNVAFNIQGLSVAEEGASSSTPIYEEINGNTTIELSENVNLSVSPNPVYYKNASSRAGNAGLVFAEKIYNAGEWFTFEGLKLGLGGKGWGISLVKANADDGSTNVDAEDIGTNFDVGGAHSNYEPDLFTNHNTVGKGALITAQFYPTYLWTYNTTNSKSWVYNSNWHQMNTTSDLGGFFNNPNGGKLRIGIDTDLKFKLQVFDTNTGTWKTVMYSNEPADPRADGYKCVWNPYYGYSQLNVLPNITTLGSSNGGQLPTYSNTHCINFRGTTTYADQKGTPNPNTIGSFGSKWAIAVSVDELSSIVDYNKKLTLFKNGNCEVAFVKAGNTVGTNFAIYAYCNGKSVLQANTWVNPIGGKLIIIGDETGLSYWLSNHLLTAPKVDANFITSYGGDIAEAVSDRFVFADTIANSRFVGCLNDLMLIDGIASQLSNEQILEYFTTDDPTELSFWDNVTHFYNCGEDSYPDILDLKGAQDMELVDGLENDFKLK